VIRESEEAMEIFSSTIKKLEEVQQELAKLFQLDVEGVPFHRKKVVTSAMRRLLPEGVATTIGWSANIRTIRWVIEARTAPDAEEEIRFVFGKVAEIMVKEYPNLFFDFEKEIVEGLPWWRPKYSKV
jgi:thymidylate synthase (FAD)